MVVGLRNSQPQAGRAVPGLGSLRPLRQKTAAMVRWLWPQLLSYLLGFFWMYCAFLTTAQGGLDWRCILFFETRNEACACDLRHVGGWRGILQRAWRAAILFQHVGWFTLWNVTFLSWMISGFPHWRDMRWEKQGRMCSQKNKHQCGTCWQLCTNGAWTSDTVHMCGFAFESLVEAWWH